MKFHLMDFQNREKKEKLIKLSELSKAQRELQTKFSSDYVKLCFLLKI